MTVINGNKLLPGKTYLMKVWNHRKGRPFKTTEKVFFTNYIFNGRVVRSGSFKMADLLAGGNQTCVLQGAKSGTITLTVTDPKIWVDSGNNRITFDT